MSNKLIKAVYFSNIFAFYNQLDKIAIAAVIGGFAGWGLQESLYDGI